MSKDWDEKLAEQKYGVEHALELSARSAIIMPVRFLYEAERLEEYRATLATCHIYMIGHLPIIESTAPGQIEKDEIITSWLVAGKPYEVRTKIPEGCSIHAEYGRWWIIDPEGNSRKPDKLLERARKQLGDEQNAIPFTVLYVGQAYGKNGSRQALDRLLKGHEKLQEILAKGPPEGHALYLLLIDAEPGTTLNTIFNPQAKNHDDTFDRILKGLQKQEETSEAEKTTLYEASLIRYFRPPYNKEFKETFPSTNMTLLAGCYDKDISSIVASLCIDAEYQLKSDSVPQKKDHVINHDLHADKDRKIFFGFLNES